MTKQKAEKHLKNARECLGWLREEYVETMRDPNWKRLDQPGWIGKGPYTEKMEGLRKRMEEVKERIARLERIAL